MSEQQINQILKRLDQQDKALSDISKKLTEFEPVKQAFDNVMGFDKVAMWALKGLALLGAGLGVLYAFINWIRHS